MVRSSNPVAFDEMERAVVDMRERFLSIGEHISGLLSTLTQQIDTAPPAARASINSAAEQIARTQQKLRLQMTNLPTHPEERYQIMRSLLQAQSGALQQLSIIVQQFTPQHDQRDGLASLSMSGNDYDYDWPPPAPRGVIQPLPNEHYAPPSRRAPRKAKPPPLPAKRPPSEQRMRGATMVAIVSSRLLAGLAFMVVAAVVAYSYFPDLGNLQGKRRVEPVAITVIGAEARKDQAALGETPALPPRGLRTRAQPAAEAPSEPAAAVETAALPQRTQVLPDIATTDPGTSVTAGSNLLSPFPGMPRARDPAPVVEQRSAPQVLVTTKPSIAAADSDAVPEAPPQFVAVVFTHQDRGAALDAFTELRERYPNVLAKRKVEAQPIEIADKGVWHRLVVLPAGTRQNAVGVCDRLGAAGYDRCWVKTY